MSSRLRVFALSRSQSPGPLRPINGLSRKEPRGTAARHAQVATQAMADGGALIIDACRTTMVSRPDRAETLLHASRMAL